MSEPVVLILTGLEGKRVRADVERIAQMLDCKTPFEVINIFEWQRRWGQYDWDSSAFQRAILKRYRKICIYGRCDTDTAKLLEKLRPIYERRTQ